MLKWGYKRSARKSNFNRSKKEIKMLLNRLFYLLIVGFLIVAACTPQPSPVYTAPIPTTSLPSLVPTIQVTETLASSPHPFAGEKAWIAYQTNRTGEGIWLIHPDGTEDHQVATDVPTAEQKYGNWSPDGTKLVFTTRGGETEPLYEYDLATNRSRQLFECKDPCVGDDEPVYSPDGTKVAFIRALAPFVHSDAFGGEVPSDCGLWIGDVASREVTRITSNPECDREYFPQWSPDGLQLTYWRDPYENGKPTGTAVFVINADGSNERRLTDPQIFAGDPHWSPDGEWIVFSTYPLNEFNFVPAISDLYRIHPDGTGMKQLTHYNSEELRATIPRYTPDGKWIIFTAVQGSSNTQERRTDRSLWIIPAEGGEPIKITSGGIYVHGVWQP
jgi:TolB protein